MKSNRILSLVVLATLLSISLAASAQHVIDFNSLPRTGVPLPIPSGYAGMNWGSMDYFTQLLINHVGNVALPGTNSFAQTISAVNPSQPFQLLGMSVTGIWGTTLTIHAYNNGVFVGSQSYPLSPYLPPVRIPDAWGNLTQVTLVCRDAQQRPAIYTLSSLTLP